MISMTANDAAADIRGTLPPELSISPQRLMQSLSFSHFAELIAVEDALKRRFTKSSACEVIGRCAS